MSIATLLLAIAVAVAALVWWRFFSPPARQRRQESARASALLRDQVLSGRIFSVPKATQDANPGCVAADFSLGGTSFVTVAAFNDGTVSLYQSTGGGVLGAGSRADVADVATEFRRQVAAHAAKFERTEAWSPPSPGHAVYYIVTPSETRSYSPGRHNPARAQGELVDLFRYTLGLVNHIHGMKVIPPRPK